MDENERKDINSEEIENPSENETFTEKTNKEGTVNPAEKEPPLVSVPKKKSNLVSIIAIVAAAAVVIAVVVFVALGGSLNTPGGSVPNDDGGSETNTGNNNSDENNVCNHTYGVWKTIEAATCLEDGEQIRVCSKCSHAEKKQVDALGHTTSNGTCSRCNQYFGSLTEESAQKIIQIHDVYVSDIDSADGVDMRISWTNTSDKTIKYVHFYVVPYNAVGDKMYCDIRDYSRFDAYVTGPCEPGYEGYYKVGDIYYGNLWEDVWYNSSVSTIELVGIKIMYMDGSIIDIGEDDVSKTFVPFSPLKEGYGMDEAFIEYNADQSNHRFYWAIEYLGVPVRPNVNIDVRIVNSNNVEVFYGEYYSRSENYTEINMYGVNKWMIATSVYDNEIKSGNVSTGTFYYHIWSDDGTIDLGERSLAIDNLPISSSVTQELPTKLRIGFSPDYAPFSYIDGNANWIGFDKEYITEIAKLLGYKTTDVEFIMVNQFDDLFTGLSANKYDIIISGIVGTEERNQ